MLARGSLGNPWRFERLLGLREGEPTRQEVAEELRWVIASAEEHLGTERAGRYLRKFYPWYSETMGLTKRENQELCTAPTTAARARRHRPPSWRICHACSRLTDRYTCAFAKPNKGRKWRRKPSSQPRVSRT